MKRREFLAASIAASASGLAPRLAAQNAGQIRVVFPRQFYLLQRFQLENGMQSSLVEKYIAEALVPAWKDRGPVGAFKLDIGPETPAFYVLIPGFTPGVLATLDDILNANPEYKKAAEPFVTAPASAPAFVRMESSLLSAFQGWPRLTPPDTKSQRIFQLRTYESPSLRDHAEKIRMFHSGEFDVFKAAGFRPVFFGDTLIGTRMPNLTYMLAFSDLNELNTCWNRFRDNPEWKKLSSDPRFAYEPIVSNITNLVLTPLSCSQI